MINRKQAKAKGIVTKDGGSRLQANKDELRKELKALLPCLVNGDGHLDAKALQDVVDVAKSQNNYQGYELTFAGKGLARAIADSPTEYKLKAELAQSKNFCKTGNVVIRGDNIDALKILYQNYFGKIKIIYIDPPYNTESENFVYKDNFKVSDQALIEEYGLDEKTINYLHDLYGTRKHSSWLSFMYPRLKLARELLTDDGVIFISIDDNEHANLKIMCDQIFSERNCVGVIKRRAARKTAHLSNKMSDMCDYVLVYAKREIASPLSLELTQDYTRPVIQESNKVSVRKIRAGTEAKCPDTTIPAGEYVNKTLLIEFLSDAVIKGGKLVKEVSVKARFRVSQEILDKTVFITKKHFLRRYLQDKEKGKPKTINDLWDEPETYNEKGTEDLNSLLSCKEVFKNPKPVKLISNIIKSCAHNGDVSDGVFILDFFAGSGTTGDAVMQLNAEDGGNRKFILVQSDEQINKKKSRAAHDFCAKKKLKPFISSIMLKRLDLAGEKIKKAAKQEGATLLEGEKLLPDVGYKVYSLVPKTQMEIEEKKGKLLPLKSKSPKKENMDKLSNMLCIAGETLDTEIECVVKDKLYKTESAVYLLDAVSGNALKNYKDLHFYMDGWADIDLTALLNMGMHDKRKKGKLTLVY